MKRVLFLVIVFMGILSIKAFSQTVYINESGDTYHTKGCKYYTKNFKPVPLWKAIDVLGKKPCRFCHPPTKVTQTKAKKKAVKKKKSVKKKAPAKKPTTTTKPK